MREINSAPDKATAIRTPVPPGKKSIDAKESSGVKEPMSDSTMLDDENLTAFINSLRGLST